MGRHTNIEWADSTINLAAGCDGCELFHPDNAARGIQDHCYAATLTARYKGTNKGFPERFDDPVIFPQRIQQIASWGDLTGTKRPAKPWLNDLPRHIFHGDMGDYFTESLPMFWLLDYIDQMAAMPHVHMLLTKRPSRMAAVFREYGHVPANFLLGTSVTGRATLARAAALIRDCGQMTNDLFLSVEPLVEEVDLARLFAVNFDFTRFLVIVGGESGPGARPFRLEWAQAIRDTCRKHEIAFFMKQTGSNAFFQERPWRVSGKGDKLINFPPDLRIRMMSWERDWAQMLVAQRGA